MTVAPRKPLPILTLSLSLSLSSLHTNQSLTDLSESLAKTTWKKSSNIKRVCLISSQKKNQQMGASITLGSTNSSVSQSHYHTHRVFLFCNYILLGAASSCIFLTLSLRLVPSICGFFLILLHVFTIAGAVSGCAAASSGTNRWYAAHMVATVLTAIFQGSVSVLIFTRTGDFLGNLKSYVREEDGDVILKLAGGLCVVIFCLEWVVLTLAFFLKYYAYVEGDANNGGDIAMRRSAKVQQDEDLKDWPWPFQV